MGVGGEDRDLYATAVEAARSVQITIGHVGTSDGRHVDAGNPDGREGERHTLVYVTLGGSNASKLRGPDRGQVILCAINSLNGHRVPAVGTRVVIAIPEGMEESPGAAVIIAVVADDPDRLETDRRVLDFTGEHVVIKGKSVSIQSDENEFVSVGEPRSGGVTGVTIQAKDGSGAVFQVGVASMFCASDGDAKSVLQLTPTKAELVHKTSGFVRLAGGGITTLSNEKAAFIAGNTFIGPNVAGGLPAAIGGAPGVFSATVFIGGPA